MVLESFDGLLKEYADLVVTSGINVQRGHIVFLYISVDQAPFARKIVKSAYEKGAGKVVVKWTDNSIAHAEFTYQDMEELKTVEDYRVSEMNYILDNEVSRISVVSTPPDGFKEINEDKIRESRQAQSKIMEPLWQATITSKMSTSVVAAAGKEWADKVFPGDEDAVSKLWDAIFKAVHLYDPDPVATWAEKDKALENKAEELNKEQFTALHYSAPGTDLTVGLPKGHIWKGVGSFNSRGERYMANMPSEEIFTAPDASRADGVVLSTKPLSYAGTIIENMEFHFKDGEITEVSAEKGEEVLRKLIEEHEGGNRLGEVALVPHASPISQSGLIFYKTLFDENASNHLALGSAYAFNLEGGNELSQEKLTEAGLNYSTTHVDFMIGSDQMDVDGIKEDGTRLPISRKGDWA